MPEVRENESRTRSRKGCNAEKSERRKCCREGDILGLGGGLRRHFGRFPGRAGGDPGLEGALEVSLERPAGQLRGFVRLKCAESVGPVHSKGRPLPPTPKKKNVAFESTVKLKLKLEFDFEL